MNMPKTRRRQVKVALVCESISCVSWVGVTVIQALLHRRLVAAFGAMAATALAMMALHSWRYLRTL
jgi:hypothetical protein